MPYFSHFSIDAWMFRTFFAPPVLSLHAYVGIHAPNLSLAIACPLRFGGRSSITRFVLLLSRFPVSDLEGRAAAGHAVGSVDHAGRPARVHARGEGLSLAQVDQLTLQDPDFLPEVVRDRLGGLDARLEA